MYSIPLEIIYMVCSFLDVDDIQRFRLASKLLAAVGAAYMLPTVSFRSNREDHNRLTAISLHPVFSKHVTTLTYYADIIGSPKVSWVEYLQRRDARMLLRERVVSEVQLAIQYIRYCDADGEQDRLKEDEGDLSAFKEFLPPFPHLKALRMVADLDEIYLKSSGIRMSKSRPIVESSHFTKILHPKSKRALEGLLNAVAQPL
ncbi:hypothetical protein F5Y08DRAFT_349964 [Xylaria arbuscula]|nr:hypothetical protein F5Y08DRAFT_349964 [Xylaria arbuscula]